MKVENPFGTLFDQIASKKSGAEKADTNRKNFSEILEKAKGPDPTEGKSPLAAPGEIVSKMELTSVQKKALSRGEETLTLLGHLAGLLEKSADSSSLESIAGALDSNSSELLALKTKLEQGDPLAKTIDEITVLSMVEKIKITRGDYT